MREPRTAFHLLCLICLGAAALAATLGCTNPADSSGEAQAPDSAADAPADSSPSGPAVPPAVPYLVIDTFYPNGGGLSDTQLLLIDAVGTVLAEDDDGNPLQGIHDGYSRIELPGGLPAGVYCVRVINDSGTGSPYYAIRVLDFDPGTSFPTLSTTNEKDGGSDDAVDALGVPINPVPIQLGDAGALSRAVFPVVTDVDWVEFVLK
jgi:hypothetical protein